MTAALLGPVGSLLLGGVGTLVVVAVISVLSPAMRRLVPLADIVPETGPDSAGSGALRPVGSPP